MVDEDDVAAGARSGVTSSGAVCVVGLPDSGVGMVSRLLRERGLWLGVPPLTGDEADAKRALDLIARAAAGSPWGWRHAGDLTTLPFWCRLVAPLKAVVCVRQEYTSEAISIAGPHDASRGAYEAVLRTLLPPWQIIITHYESWFAAPHLELERITAFLDLSVSRSNAVAQRFIRSVTSAKEPSDVLPSSAEAFLAESSSFQSLQREPIGQRKAA